MYVYCLIPPPRVHSHNENLVLVPKGIMAFIFWEIENSNLISYFNWILFEITEL